MHVYTPEVYFKMLHDDVSLFRFPSLLPSHRPHRSPFPILVNAFGRPVPPGQKFLVKLLPPVLVQ